MAAVETIATNVATTTNGVYGNGQEPSVGAYKFHISNWGMADYNISGNYEMICRAAGNGYVEMDVKQNALQMQAGFPAGAPYLYLGYHWSVLGGDVNPFQTGSSHYKPLSGFTQWEATYRTQRISGDGGKHVAAWQTFPFFQDLGTGGAWGDHLKLDIQIQSSKTDPWEAQEINSNVTIGGAFFRKVTFRLVPAVPQQYCFTFHVPDDYREWCTVDMLALHQWALARWHDSDLRPINSAHYNAAAQTELYIGGSGAWIEPYEGTGVLRISGMQQTINGVTYGATEPADDEGGAESNIYAHDFETGTLSFAASTGTEASVVTSPVHAGSYAGRVGSGGTGFWVGGALDKSEIYLRARVYLEVSATPPATATAVLMVVSDVAWAWGGYIRHIIKPDGTSALSIVEVGAWSSGPEAVVPRGQWLDLEWRVTTGSPGTSELRLNGETITTHEGTFGPDAIQRVQYTAETTAADAGVTWAHYFDDISASDQGWQAGASSPPTIHSVVVTPDPVYWGQTATCTVDATGHDALAYQWLWDGQPIQGATSSTYTLPASEGEIVIDAPPAPPTGLSAIII